MSGSSQYIYILYLTSNANVELDVILGLMRCRNDLHDIYMIIMNRISVQQTRADCSSCFKSGPKTDVTVRTGALNVDMMHGSSDMMGSIHLFISQDHCIDLQIYLDISSEGL